MAPNAFVKKLVGYAALSDREVDLLLAVSNAPRAVPAYRDLIREGDDPSMVFVVLDGWACRYNVLPDGSRQIVAFMMPGDFCDPHVTTLEAMDHSLGTITPCRIAAIPREQMETLIVATPALTQAFWRAQLVDQAVMRSWIISIGRRNAVERVAHLMLELYVRMRNVGLAGETTCDIPLTQAAIADAVGLTSVHINRVLRVLREQKAMTLRSGRLTIDDAGGLAKIAGFDESYLHRRIRATAGPFP